MANKVWHEFISQDYSFTSSHGRTSVSSEWCQIIFVLLIFLGSFVKDTVAAETRNESPPCQIVPGTDDPSTGVITPPPAVSVSKPGRDTYQKLPSNVFYPPIAPYYVPPPNLVSGGVLCVRTRCWECQVYTRRGSASSTPTYWCVRPPSTSVALGSSEG